MVLLGTLLWNLRTRCCDSCSQSTGSHLAMSNLWCYESGDGVLLLFVQHEADGHSLVN